MHATAHLVTATAQGTHVRHTNTPINSIVFLHDRTDTANAQNLEVSSRDNIPYVITPSAVHIPRLFSQ